MATVNMAQNDAYDVFVLDLDNVQVHNIDFYTSIQERLRRVGEEFSTFAQMWWGKEAANFLDSAPGDDRMDDSWQPVRILGKGGFGLVGLWQKFNKDHEVEDEIALKEMDYPDFDHYHVRHKAGLSREAVIMKQLNEAEKSRYGRNKNILRLRSFKHFPAHQKWRFYLEFAPYGDLSRLIYFYRAWNVYLPEEFLWHVFNSLARVAVVMDEGRFTDLETQEHTDRTVTHFDIKPDNIYLAKADGTATFTNYPIMKVADFGLAMLTGKNNKDNPKAYRILGTPDYYAPEQRCFAVHWQKRPNGFFQHQVDRRKTRLECERDEKYMDEPGYQFLSAHNIWGFGKLMYDMLGLQYPVDLDQTMDKEISENKYYNKYDEHGIPPITTKRTPEYSSSLRDLIRECLHIEIGKRPSPRALLDRTTRGLQEAAESNRTDPQDFNGPRVYYMGHEINHMPAGDARRIMRREDLEIIKKDLWPDPTWQPLLSGRWAPQVINGDFVNEPVVEGGPKRELPPLAAVVNRDPRGLKHNPRGVNWAFQWPNAKDDKQSDGGNNQRNRDEEQYQHELGGELRDSGPHDTQELPPPPKEGDQEGPRTSKDREPEPVEGEAIRLPQPENVPAGPEVRLSGPRKSPDQQPQPKKKRKRPLGLSIDMNFQEAEGRVVGGRNLRKRRG